MTTHALDPLTAEEITRATTLFRDLSPAGPAARFALVLLEEPTRAELAAYRDGVVPDRRARLVTVDRDGGPSLDGVVSLTTGELVRVRTVDPVTGGQPPVLVEEYEEVEEIVKADPAWQAAVRARGVERIDLVQVDPVSAGRFDLDDETGLRLIRAVSYGRCDEEDNAYAHPIDGLIAHVDLTHRRVLRIEDDEVLRQPVACSNFHDHNGIAPRTDLKALDIVQPDGPTFEVDGWRVAWQKWSLRLSVNPREGLVLHDVSYDDDGRERSVFHRLAVAEMVVPYGDPRPAHFWRSAFDAGEYGLGTLMQSLTLGCDCLGVIHYFDAAMSDSSGAPYVVQNAVCMHEEDFGVLWRHSDIRYGGSWVRRSRRLVISFFATVGNYDYGFFWYLYQDGRIEFEAKLTGIMQTATLPEGTSSPYLSRVGPELGAQVHQHFFCVRIDPAVDGPRNSVVEVDVHPVPMGEDNPRGNAFTAVPTVLARETDAQRLCDPLANRTWRIVSEGTENGLGGHPGYQLVPAGGPVLHADPESFIARRAAFATRHLWVTRYDADERYPSGDFPNQGAPDGVARWAEQDRALADEEIVVWHSFGSTHIPKPEDWPIMPVDHIGFLLKPSGFFDRNAALDVPPSVRHGDGPSCH